LRRKALKWSVMVSDMQQTVPQLPPFNWQREYAPLWEGRNEGHLNDILFGPGPNDVLTIDGIRAPFKDHLARAYMNTARKGTIQ
jgi:hypothetical protein